MKVVNVDGLMRRVGGFIEILRVHNLFVSAMATLLGFESVYVIVGRDVAFNPVVLTLSTVVVVLIAAGGYVINDYYDAEIDLINKPSRPIPSGRVSRTEALTLSLLLIFLGVVISSYIGVISFMYAVFNATLLILYSKRLKKEGFAGNLAISTASANSIIYGGLTLSEVCSDLTLVKYTLIPATYAFVFTLMREIIKGIEDVTGDLRVGVKTLAITRGVKQASKISIILMLLIVLFSPYPYISGVYGTTYLILVLITDVLLIYSALKLGRTTAESDIIKASSALRSYTKVAMFLGITAFLVDLIVRLF